MASLDLHLPTALQAAQAEHVLRILEELRRGIAPLQVRVEGAAEQVLVTLPDDVVTLLLRILGHMANGDAVGVVPVHAEITPSEAADILGVSEHFVNRLITEGKIRCRTAGARSWLPLSELLTFKQKDKAERRAIAAELTAETQDLGFDY